MEAEVKHLSALCRPSIPFEQNQMEDENVGKQ